MAGFTFANVDVGAPESDTFQSPRLNPDGSISQGNFPPYPPPPNTGFFVISKVKIIKLDTPPGLTTVPQIKVGNGTGSNDQICRTQALPSSFLTAPVGTAFDFDLAPDQQCLSAGDALSLQIVVPTDSSCICQGVAWGVYLPLWS